MIKVFSGSQDACGRLRKDLLEYLAASDEVVVVHEVEPAIANGTGLFEVHHMRGVDGDTAGDFANGWAACLKHEPKRLKRRRR